MQPRMSHLSPPAQWFLLSLLSLHTIFFLRGHSDVSVHYIIFFHPCYCLVAQSCPNSCDPVDCNPPGSSVYGISQARILEWVAISSSILSPTVYTVLRDHGSTQIFLGTCNSTLISLSLLCFHKECLHLCFPSKMLQFSLFRPIRLRTLLESYVK